MAVTTDPRARRIGLLVPSTNTVMEPDLAGGLAGVATVHTARMPLATVTADAERAMIAAAPSAAKELGGLDLALCVFGCTSAGAVAGADDSGLRRLADELRAACGAPVVSVLECVAERLRAVDARRVAVLTPYDAELTATVGGHVAAEGFDVVSCVGLGIRDNVEIGAMHPDSIVSVVTGQLGGCSADAVFISCTNLRALEARGAITAALGIPVVTSNSAVVDAVGDRLAGPEPASTGGAPAAAAGRHHA